MTYLLVMIHGCNVELPAANGSYMFWSYVIRECLAKNEEKQMFHITHILCCNNSYYQFYRHVQIFSVRKRRQRGEISVQ